MTIAEVSLAVQADAPHHASDSIHTFLDEVLVPVGYGTSFDTNNGFAARFLDVPIPQGAKILAAHLVMEANATDANVVVNARIDGLASDDAPTPTHAEYDGGTVGVAGHGRATANRTVGQVLWSGIEAIVAGQEYQTPNFAVVAQEIVSRPGWVEGNAMTIFVGDDDNESDQETSHFRTYKNASPAMRLVITYEVRAAEYTFRLRNPRTLALLAELPKHGDISWTRRTHDEGLFFAEVHLDHIAVADIPKHAVLEVRKDTVFEFAGVIEVRKYNPITRMWELGGRDAKGFWLTSRQIVRTEGGAEFDSQSGVVAETAMKHYVNDHLVAPTDSARDVNAELTGIDFTTEGTHGWGATVDKHARWEKLLRVLVELARKGDLFHDVVLKPNYIGYEYQVYQPVDATETGGGTPVVFGVAWENVAEALYIENYSDIINALYALGSGSGSTRKVREVAHAASITADFRREGRADIRQGGTDNDALDMAGNGIIDQSLLDALTARMTPLRVGPTQYRRDWDLGYEVTLAFNDIDVTLDRRIEEVKVTVTADPPEKIEIRLGARPPELGKVIAEALRQSGQVQVA